MNNVVIKYVAYMEYLEYFQLPSKGRLFNREELTDWLVYEQRGCIMIIIIVVSGKKKKKG